MHTQRRVSRRAIAHRVGYPNTPTKPGLVSVLCLSMRYTVLVSLLCVLFFGWFGLSLLAKWLARKTPLRKPNHGEGIVSRKPRPKSVCDFLVYCIASLFHYLFVLSPDPTWYNYFPAFRARYSLFVLEVQLNPKQTNKPDPPITLTLTVVIITGASGVIYWLV